MTERKTALVTGASSGIGREIARLFAADGHDLVVVARSADKLEELAQELAAAHDVNVHVEPTDLASPQAPRELFETLEAKDVAIDFLVNNAGFGDNGTFWELDRERQLAQIRVNISALTELTHLFLPAMIARGFGRILNVASTAGFQPGPYMSVYYATKAYVVSFTEGIAHELKDTGVTATAHCPGATQTQFASTAGNDETLLFKAGVATAQDVARHAYRAMHRGKVVAVHGPMNWLGAATVGYFPRAWVRYFTAKMNR